MDRRLGVFDLERDLDAAARIWREVRWIDDSDAQKNALGSFLEGTHAEVGILADAIECLVARRTGTITYDTTALPLSAVAAVTTSHLGRKQRFASTLTARCVALGADDGAAVAALGMFEQGFYDRFGFGTAGSDHKTSFDPQSLRVSGVGYRPPIRLDAADSAAMSAAMAARLDHHGRVVLLDEAAMAAEYAFIEQPMALGYRDDTGALTHFFAGSLKGENGPLDIDLIAYRSIDQFAELLRLLHELGDQIRSVKMFEPATLPMQSLIDSPMRQRQRSIRSDMETVNRATAWWQLRIVDLERCVAARTWEGEPIRFDLALSDPVTPFLDDADLDVGDAPQPQWRGISGDYTVTVGAPSSVEVGHTGRLPKVRCDVGAFSRLWFGVAPASTLHLTDDFAAPVDLATRLDRALRLPPTVPSMLF